MCYNRGVPEHRTVANAEERRRAKEQARLKMARMRVGADRSLFQVLQASMETAADALHVERAGIWLLVNDGRALRCFDVFERAKKQHSEGALLQADDFPAYFRALHERTNLPAVDARTNPLTHELRAAYLEPLGIVAMLDAPIFQNGQVIGVVCHEHLNTPREWSAEERDFARSVADEVAMRLETAARLEAETRLLANASELAELSKMEALGRLAAGVAHDFNNMLAVVLAHAHRIPTLAESTPRIKEAAREIEEAARRGAALAQELLSFGRERASEPRVLDLVRATEEFASLLQTAVGNKHQLEVTRTGPSGRVLIDRSQLERLLLNLCVNARDAMPGGGRIQVGVGETRVGDASEGDGIYVLLTVRDEGIGMDEAVQSRLFEPFFTTKPTGKGTGLGLSIVYKIVERCGGFIHVESAPGRGTCFHVYLPRIAAES
jgi:signal transduction histidine kinase